MHYPFQLKPAVFVSALILLISINTTQANTACKIHSEWESDSLSSNVVTGNGAFTYSKVIVTESNFNDSLQISTSIPKNIEANNNPSSQADSLTHNYVPKWYSFITNLPGDMVDFYDQEFTVKNVPIYLGIGALTTGLIITDNQTWKVSDKYYKKSGFDKSASDIFVEIGDGRSQFGLAAAFALYGFITDDSRALRTASEVVEAVLASGAVVQALKHITGRESPFVSTRPGGAWRFFPNQIQYLKHVPAFDAYPSGHLTTSLAAFVVIAENYPEAKWIRPVCYTTETLLAISMVNTGIHWYSDYPLAVFLGYEFGKIISHHGDSQDDSKNSENNPHLAIEPFFNQIDEGLTVSLVF